MDAIDVCAKSEQPNEYHFYVMSLYQTELYSTYLNASKFNMYYHIL